VAAPRQAATALLTPGAFGMSEEAEMEPAQPDDAGDVSPSGKSEVLALPAMILYHLFEQPEWFDKMGVAGKPFKLTSALLVWFINVLIIISTFAFCVESLAGHSADPHRNPETWEEKKVLWTSVEVTCVLFFTLDVLVRLVGAIAAGTIAEEEKDPENENQEDTYFALFLADTMNWIDVLAIAPFYLQLIFTFMKWGTVVDLRFLRVIRLARILKSLPSARHGSMINLITDIVTNSTGALMIPLYFMALSVIVFSSIVYYVEESTETVCTLHDGTVLQPWDTTQATNEGCTEAYGCACAGTLTYISRDGVEYSSDMFTSIPDTCWWCVVTFTTVGYGDSYPRTGSGQLVCIMSMFVGVFFLAMPLSIVGNAFTSSWKGFMKKKAINLARDKMDAVTSTMEESGSEAVLLTVVDNLMVVEADQIIQSYLKIGLDSLGEQCKTGAHGHWQECFDTWTECNESWAAAHEMLSNLHLIIDNDPEVEKEPPKPPVRRAKKDALDTE